MYTFVSLGYRCSISSIMQNLGIKKESYPFDWIVSDLLVKIEIINNKFADFLNISNYEYVENGEVYNIINKTKKKVAVENYLYNKLYGNNENGLYHTKIGLNHYDLNNKDNYDYFIRCVDRFNNLLENPDKKIFLYLNPIISSDEISNTINNINIFSNYFKTITNNFCIIYYILVYTENNNSSFDIYDNSENKLIVIINCNKNFIDYYSFDISYHSNTESDIICNIINDVINNNIKNISN